MKRGTLFHLLISFIQLSFLSLVAMLVIFKHRERKIEISIIVLVN